MLNEPTPSNVTGDRVRQLRRSLGWSVEDLAERCAEIGAANLTVPALYVIESGRRDKETGRRRRMITVDEWLALSRAFGVAPLVLLLPHEAAAEFQITSDVSAGAEAVFRWLIGRWPDIRPARESTLSDEVRHRYMTNRPNWMNESVELTGREALAQWKHMAPAAHAVARAARESGLTRGNGKAFLQSLEPLVANILLAGENYDPNDFDADDKEGDASGEDKTD